MSRQELMSMYPQSRYEGSIKNNKSAMHYMSTPQGAKSKFDAANKINLGQKANSRHQRT